MRFKKIVFGLILSLMLAFPAYASEIIPISVDNAGVNSIIQPRGYVWSGTVPLPDAQYYYTMPDRSGTTTEVTISPKPGENIQLSCTTVRVEHMHNFRIPAGSRVILRHKRLTPIHTHSQHTIHLQYLKVIQEERSVSLGHHGRIRTMKTTLFITATLIL